MRLLYVKLDIATASDGSATATAPVLEGIGLLHKVEWVDGTLADGVDAVLKCINRPSGIDETLLTLTNADNDAVYYPRYIIHSEAGAALTGTSGGDRAQGIVEGTFQLTVTNGGDTKTGAALIYYLVND